MTSFDALAVYQHNRLEITIPAHNQFFVDLFKALPLRCIAFQSSFSFESPRVDNFIRDGHHYEAELIFRKHFPWAHVVGAVR